MYLAIIVLPLLGSIVSGLFGRKVGISGSQLITCSSIIITTTLAIIVFTEVGLNNIPVHLKLFRWIDSESLNALWAFQFDCLTVSMLIPVLIVSSLVHIYSIGYMSHDPHNQRFFSYLSLFTFMMIILVTANNLLLMFVGWEGVGICSYLLVSFWFTRIAANQSSISAFLTNRVGDCFLTIGMFAVLWSFGNLDYSTIFSLAPFISENIVTITGICLLIGAMAKSSQVGLHVWLPMAMEGPTPVSALIHAATMVTAGVYILMRTSPLIEYSNTVLMLCLWIGAITTVFSSLIGLFQQDIKKVIAYSTMSQLGMMVIAVGLSSYNIALFHLVNHAFYKGLLFLGAGAVIHAVSDNQDFRKYGGLRSFLPLTYSVMLIASLSLVAFPYMTGFYSKDFILESAYGQFYFSSTVVYFIATIGAMFTTLYSVKVLYLTFLTNPNGPLVNYKQPHEGDIYMTLPLIILAFFSIFFGYISKDMFIGLGSDFFADNSLFIHPLHEIMLNTEFAVPHIFKLLPLILTIILIITSIIFSEFLPNLLIFFKFTRLGYNIFSFFNQRFLIELFYNIYISNIIFKLGGQTTKVLDKGSVEYIGPYGLEKALFNLSSNLSRLDTGVITSYALYILIALIFYILIPYLFLADSSLLIVIIFALSTLNTFNAFIKSDRESNSENESKTNNENESDSDSYIAINNYYNNSSNLPINSSVLDINVFNKYSSDKKIFFYKDTNLFSSLVLAFLISLIFIIYLIFEIIDLYNYVDYIKNIMFGYITIATIYYIFLTNYLKLYLENLLYNSFYFKNFLILIEKGFNMKKVSIFIYNCIRDIYNKYLYTMIFTFITTLYFSIYFSLFINIIFIESLIAILLTSLYVCISINYIDLEFKYKYPYIFIFLNVITIILIFISIYLINNHRKALSEKLYQLFEGYYLNINNKSNKKSKDNPKNNENNDGSSNNKPNKPNQDKDPITSNDKEKNKNKGKGKEVNTEGPEDDRESCLRYPSSDNEEEEREELNAREEWRIYCALNNLDIESGDPLTCGPSNSHRVYEGNNPNSHLVQDPVLEDWEIEEIKKNKKKISDHRYYEKHKEKITKNYKEYYEKNKEAIAADHKLYKDVHQIELSHKKRKYNDEHREEISKYNSRYYEENYDEIIKRNKAYRDDPENKKKIKQHSFEYRKENLEAIREYDRNRRKDEKSILSKKEYDKERRKRIKDNLSEEQKQLIREKDRIRAQNKRAKKKDKEDKDKNNN